ncbi:MAG TPA: PQQ-binding-like beta-propeller repeat protein [Acetobacteraceae bacterium]|nr:PQQ-binding-like beta-propeller repeat protein [Acetobacteraceae bacterium]
MRIAIRRQAGIVIVVTVVIVAVLGIYEQPEHGGSHANSGSYSTEKIWNAVSCRAALYRQKAEGTVPELSWNDLWVMTRLRRGFHCIEGSSLAADLQYSSAATEDDIKEGAQIFRERCTGCHGSNGTGGPFAPSLIGSRLTAGDSDLAMYQVLRHGRPGTAMRPIDLPPRQLLQIIAYVTTLRAHSAATRTAEAPRVSIDVRGERLRAAGTKTDEWLTYSGSYDGSRHTTLDQITPANVANLRIRWIKQFDIQDSNIEATPLVVNGIMFFVPDASHVVALDARTGDEIWAYKASLPADLPLGYGQANRGLAVYGNTLFLGGLDGHLIALNASDGAVVWQTLVASPSDGYSITVAPLVVDHSVVVGVSGGDYGIRGFLAAYDVGTGRQQWKFYTVPGPGEPGHETWGNDDAWRTGGGATWVTGSYDPTTDLLYWGVGNPGPDFDGDVRPGDNLFTDCVIALHASTGRLAWHFQFTPHDDHDRDAAQTPVLADLTIKGVARRVILWPNRNGFYYVLDRVTGEYLVGVPFVPTDWATELTPTGRPVLTAAAKVTTAGRRTEPGINGAVNWQNPSFDQSRGTIFIPAVESSSVFTKAPAGGVTKTPGGPYLASGFSQSEPGTNEVVALDAATGRQKWQQVTPTSSNAGGHRNSSYSGLLSTGSGLVFGASGGVLFALDADSGREIWRLPLGGTAKSAPISFSIDGHQVIAIAAGRALFVLGL